MLWEAGPGVCLCISLNPMKQRRARWSRSRAEDTERPGLTAAARQDPKAASFEKDFYNVVYIFFFPENFR